MDKDAHASLEEVVIEITEQADTAPASSAGMTGGVVQGGIWNLGGQAAVLLASLIATPFVVRLLRPELYGLLALIQSLISYIAFAGAGMPLASTKFGADAYARGDDDGEIAVVWTSLVMAAVPAALAGLALWLAARPLMGALSIPPELQDQAVLALRIASLGYFARSAYGVLNTPQAVRLRWDLITKIESGTSVLQIAVIPVVLALGGGLVSAVAVASSTEVVRVALHLVISRRLQPRLFRILVRADLVRPMLRFGGALVISSLAMIPLLNVERLFVARYGSVASVAYYSLAATVAQLLSVFPIAVCQPLLPAFTRLHTAGDRAGLQLLLARALQGTLLWTVPASVMLCVVAHPAFTIWAGTEYGRRSTDLFYILVGGLAVNAIAYPFVNALLAIDRAGVWVWCHMAELVPYIALSALLTSRYGAVGAAVAFSLRMVADCLVFSIATKRYAGLHLPLLPARRGPYTAALAMLLVPIGASVLLTSNSWLRLGIALAALLGHLAMICTRVLLPADVASIKGFVSGLWWRGG